RGRAFWQWSAQDWQEVVGPTAAAFEAAHGPGFGRQGLRPHLLDVAYLLCGFEAFGPLWLATAFPPMARVVFGAARLDGQLARGAAVRAGRVGARLRPARRFREAWFATGRGADGGRPSWDVAHARHARWHADPAYHGLAPLRRVQCSVDGAQFARLSHFLRQPVWEATSNGAERAGRAFRHGQGPHFPLRSARSIDDLLRARACVHMERATAAPLRPHGRRTRGRRCRPPGPEAVAA